MTFRERVRLAWETGEIDPDGWGYDPGEVEPQAPYQNEGSQTPPPRDRDGNILEPEAVERVATRWVRRLAKSYISLEEIGIRRTAMKMAAARSHFFEVGDRVSPAWEWLRRLSAQEIRSLQGRRGTVKRVSSSHVWVLWDEDWDNPRERPKVEKWKANELEFVEPVGGRDRIFDRLASRTAGMKRTAGEVRFIKDRGGDKNEWGWGSPGPVEREISPKFNFHPGKLKPLATTLRASLMALGHAISAYQKFVRIKSATISPDGSLGGKGYIAKIADMRRQYTNVIEALSALTDTLYDEVNAAHWGPAEEAQDPRERKKVKDIMEDVEEIREDPEGFAEDEEAEMDAGNTKKASRRKVAALRREQDRTYVNDLAQVRLRRVAEEHLARQRER
jgi:hypothetical protein